jgi:t-SNARE complex subunit (syntaxin)
MKSPKPLDKNIQFLITANYQRMMSFEQAAFLTSEQSFKAFYLQKAEESEVNMQQLYLILNVNQPADGQATALANSSADAYLPNMLTGKKSAIKILESIKAGEKTIAKWYKNTLQEIAGLPNEMIELVKEQYRMLNNAQVQLEHL